MTMPGLGHARADDDNLHSIALLILFSLNRFTEQRALLIPRRSDLFSKIVKNIGNKQNEQTKPEHHHNNSTKIIVPII
jgi:hypothetical protein